MQPNMPVVTNQNLPIPKHLSANVEPADAGVVVRHLTGRVGPGVDVEVLEVGATAAGRPDGERGADKGVVELLRVHVEEVRVALLWGHLYHLVQVQQARDLHKRLQRGHGDELVEVAGRDDLRLGVLG